MTTALVPPPPVAYENPNEEVSQGDILTAILVYRADAAPEIVRKQNVPGNKIAWTPDTSGNHAVLPVQYMPVLVVSHDCAIDKASNAANSGTELTPEEALRRASKTDVLVSPIRPVPSSWDSTKLVSVARGDVLHQFLLPPDSSRNWDGGYADLRWVVTVRLTDLLAAARPSKLVEPEVNRLQLQLERFFSWRDGAESAQ